MAFSRRVRSEAPQRSMPVNEEMVTRYRVVFAPYVNIRARPHLQAPVIATRKNGQIVTLGSWDEAHVWRQCSADESEGWMMVAHPQLGPLLKPLVGTADVVSASNVFPGETMLGVAVREGRVAEVQHLLAGRADPNEPDNLGETPLFDAAARGNSALVAMLLDARAEPGHQSVTGLAPLDFANGAEAAAILAALNPDKVASADQVVADRALRRLRRASLAGRCLDRKEEIARNGPAKCMENASQETGASASQLVTAVAEGRVIDARCLLNAGVDPNAQDDAGETPLFEAARFGDSTLVAELLDARADPNHRSLAGMTASDFVAGVDASAILAAMNPEKAASINQRSVDRALRRLRRASLLGRCLDRVEEVARQADIASDDGSGLSDSDESEDKVHSPNMTPDESDASGSGEDGTDDESGTSSLASSPGDHVQLDISIEYEALEYMNETNYLPAPPQTPPWMEEKDEVGSHRLLMSPPMSPKGEVSCTDLPKAEALHTCWEHPLTNAEMRRRAASLEEQEGSLHRTYAHEDVSVAGASPKAGSQESAVKERLKPEHQPTVAEVGKREQPECPVAKTPDECEGKCPSVMADEQAANEVREEAAGQDHDQLPEAFDSSKRSGVSASEEANPVADEASQAFAETTKESAEEIAEPERMVATETAEILNESLHALGTGEPHSIAARSLSRTPSKWDDTSLGCDVDTDLSQCISERSLPTLPSSKPNRRSISKRLVG